MPCPLGLVRESDPMRTETLITERIQLGCLSMYGFMGTGLHGLDGLHPLASIRIWETYVLPLMVHNLKAVVLRDTDLS